MKKLIFSFIAVAILAACSNDDEGYDNYRQGIGMFEVMGEGTGEYQIKLDDGDLVVPNEHVAAPGDFAEGDRVLVLYSSINEEAGEGEITIFKSDIHDIDPVLTKGVIDITEAIADSIGNDPIHVHKEDIWFGSNYLNLSYAYLGAEKVHYLNMVKFENDSVDANGNLILELRHNANDDYLAYEYRGIVSFDMNSLYKDGMDSIPVVVKIADYDGDTLEWVSTYHFE
jgi:hypothetical protein